MASAGAVPFYSAYDERGNFYWTSCRSLSIPRNVHHNDKVFLAIYDDGPGGCGEGVYIEATATGLVVPEEIQDAAMNLARRVNKDIGTEKRRLDAGVQRIYPATPTRAWVNSFESDSEGRFVRDVRVEIPVSCLEGLVNW